MNSNSDYWKNNDFGETLDERFLYILCSDYERYEDMIINNQLNREVDSEFYKERIDLLLKTKESQLEKLIQIHANEIINHRKLFYESVDLKYANRKYSITSTLSSMILHPEVEKILLNGRSMNPSQHGITEQGRGKIGTMEDVADAIKRKLVIKDDEPIIGRDELYRQYYAELGQLKERQEKELRDFLAFYKREQEYFEECLIKVKKHEKAVSPTVSSNSKSSSNNIIETMEFRPNVQVEKKINNPQKSKVTFITLDSDQSSSSSSSSIHGIHEATLGKRSVDPNNTIGSSTSGNFTPIPTVYENNANRQESVIPKTVSFDVNEQQSSTQTISPFNPVENNLNNLLNNLNPGAIQILNMLGSAVQKQDNVKIDELLKCAEKLLKN
ncbi:hypothetical protein C1645_735211 [Glomus cerebriforme]|uniref:Sds3-like-domain-containing protein n=1 Tax=Glomus cerebriforme TaxID=658196 RepID=A0A397TA88_9GLOM|nr:hypothetical protein C1645_735211 [Glomus cerebriforme]